MELFEQMRREFEFGVGTIQGVARKFGVHRRQVRQAIECSVPLNRKSVTRACPTLDPVKVFIEDILVADKTAPRKQRHTARRIWIRNPASAVKKVFRGHTRDEHADFLAFRSHWQFAAEFCAVASPQEKGGVEGEVGYFRRNPLVPVPEAANLEAFNRKLLADCIADQSRKIGDRPALVGPLLSEERAHLLPLQHEGYDLARTHAGLVDAKGCVKTYLNWYSTPLRVGTRAQIRALPSSIEAWQEGARVAVHERSYARGVEVFNLEHYLHVLDKKPGALPGARPLAQWREQGLWPESFDRLWALWRECLGEKGGLCDRLDL